jgi:transcription antitermination factor NusG
MTFRRPDLGNTAIWTLDLLPHKVNPFSRDPQKQGLQARYGANLKLMMRTNACREEHNVYILDIRNSMQEPDILLLPVQRQSPEFIRFRSIKVWPCMCNLESKYLLGDPIKRASHPSEKGEAVADLNQQTCHSESRGGPILCRCNLSRGWLTAYTAPRHEKRVAEHFLQRQIDCYLPLYSSRRRWKDGSKTILELPLFPSYIFVRIAMEDRIQVLEVPGVVSLVCCGKSPVLLPDSEVERLREGLHLRKAEPHPFLVIGERVRIRVGPLAGMEGVLLREKNSFRVVLSLGQIMRSVAVEVDRSDLEPIGESKI